MKAGKAPSEKIISCERNHKYCIGTCNNALYLCMTLHSNLVILYPICQSNIIAIIHHQVLVAVLHLQQPSQASTQNQYSPSTGCDVTGTLCQQKRTQENMNIVQHVIPEVTDGSLFIWKQVDIFHPALEVNFALNLELPPVQHDSRLKL